MTEAAVVLGVEAAPEQVWRAFADLREELAVMTAQIDEHFAENTAKHALYSKHLPEIEKSISSFMLNFRGQNIDCHIDPSAVVSLRFMAADLPQEEASKDEDVAGLRSQVDELWKAIHNTPTLPQHLRKWLLELVRIMRDGLDRYAIRGGRGLKKELTELVGQLTMNKATVEELKATSPGLLQRVAQITDVMVKVATLGEKLKPAISYAYKLIGCESGSTSGVPPAT